jgi:hypothetical protein
MVNLVKDIFGKKVYLMSEDEFEMKEKNQHIFDNLDWSDEDNIWRIDSENFKMKMHPAKGSKKTLRKLKQEHTKTEKVDPLLQKIANFKRANNSFLSEN